MVTSEPLVQNRADSARILSQRSARRNRGRDEAATGRARAGHYLVPDIEAAASREPPYTLTVMFFTPLLLLALGLQNAPPRPPPPAAPAADAAQAADAPTDPDARLLTAAMLGDVAGVKKALADGAGANAVSDSGASALGLAALHGQLAAVNALLAAGASVSAADKGGT